MAVSMLVMALYVLCHIIDITMSWLVDDNVMGLQRIAADMRCLYNGIDVVYNGRAVALLAYDSDEADRDDHMHDDHDDCGYDDGDDGKYKVRTIMINDAASSNAGRDCQVIHLLVDDAGYDVHDDDVISLAPQCRRSVMPVQCMCQCRVVACHARRWSQHGAAMVHCFAMVLHNVHAMAMQWFDCAWTGHM